MEYPGVGRVKILGYEIKDAMIMVHTDNPGRPDFVYFKDEFKTVAELKKEIESSIAAEKRINNTKELRLLGLTNELKEEVKQ